MVNSPLIRPYLLGGGGSFGGGTLDSHDVCFRKLLFGTSEIGWGDKGDLGMKKTTQTLNQCTLRILGPSNGGV